MNRLRQVTVIAILAIVCLSTLMRGGPAVKVAAQFVSNEPEECGSIRDAGHVYQNVVWTTCSIMGGTTHDCNIQAWAGYRAFMSGSLQCNLY